MSGSNRVQVIDIGLQVVQDLSSISGGNGRDLQTRGADLSDRGVVRED